LEYAPIQGKPFYSLSRLVKAQAATIRQEPFSLEDLSNFNSYSSTIPTTVHLALSFPYGSVSIPDWLPMYGVCQEKINDGCTCSMISLISDCEF